MDHLYIAWCLNLLIPCLVIDEDFVKVYEEVCRAANEKNKGIAMVHESVSNESLVALAKKVLPTLEDVLHINKEHNVTVYKASELLDTVETLLEYFYVAEEYDFQLGSQCRRILDQYDTTYKEVIIFRSRADMDKVSSKTTECLALLGKI